MKSFRFALQILVLFAAVMAAHPAAVLDGYQRWATQHFGSADSPDADPNADIDFDGYENLVEYAHDTNPLQRTLPSDCASFSMYPGAGPLSFP